MNETLALADILAPASRQCVDNMGDGWLRFKAGTDIKEAAEVAVLESIQRGQVMTFIFNEIVLVATPITNPQSIVSGYHYACAPVGGLRTQKS